jgi:hypothetical protein
MNYTKRAFLVGVITASTALLLAYGMERSWLGAMMATGLGLFVWLGQNTQKWPWSINLFLVGVVILVIIGALLALKPSLLLIAIIGALTSWDLARFQQRNKHNPVSESTRKIEKRHLSLLGLALGSGGVLAFVVLITQMQLSFGVALISGVVLIISLGQVYRLLRN